MHHSHIFGPQHFVYGTFLCGIEPRKALTVEAESLGLLARIKQIAQVGQSIPLGVDYAIERIEHAFIACFIKKQLHTHLSLRVLKVDNTSCIGENHNHVIAIYIRHHTRKVEIVQSFFGLTIHLL